MKLPKIRAALARALDADHDTIINHITAVSAEKRTTAIERQFSVAFERQLGRIEFKREVPLSRLGAEQLIDDRSDGRVDCYIAEPPTAFEYKALRLPRKASHALFDIGQLVADSRRLREATKLEYGYIVAFVYGPLLPISSARRLYQMFHNQMFIDASICRDTGELGTVRAKEVSRLGWDRVWSDVSIPPHAVAVARGNLGAICVDCRVSN